MLEEIRTRKIVHHTFQEEVIFVQSDLNPLKKFWEFSGDSNNKQILIGDSGIKMIFINEPAHEMLVLTASASSEGSDEPAHQRCSLVRAFAVHIHRV